MILSTGEPQRLPTVANRTYLDSNHGDVFLRYEPLADAEVHPAESALSQLPDEPDVQVPDVPDGCKTRDTGKHVTETRMLRFVMCQQFLMNSI